MFYVFARPWVKSTFKITFKERRFITNITLTHYFYMNLNGSQSIFIVTLLNEHTKKNHTSNEILRGFYFKFKTPRIFELNFEDLFDKWKCFLQTSLAKKNLYQFQRCFIYNVELEYTQENKIIWRKNACIVAFQSMPEYCIATE